MIKTGCNEGVRILDDFVCQAIRSPGVPKADETHQGQCEGVKVVEDLDLETSNGKSGATISAEAVWNGQMKSITFDESVRSQIHALAAWIVGTSNPRQTLDALLQVLTEQVSEIEQH